METNAIKLFQQRKFGLFIHWGLYAVPGGRYRGESMKEIGEWFQSRFRMPVREYEKFAEEFNPVKFDADAWIRKAYAAGMRYIVFTTKHHDGFAMFDSQVSDYTIVKRTPFGRDPLRELSDACRKYGVGFGVYYSQYLDWHEEDAGHPDASIGLNCGTMHWVNNWDFPDRNRKNFDRYWQGKVIPQVTELLTNYGDVCEFWCDTPLDMPERYSKELRTLIKTLQPNCLINKRIGNGCHDIQGLGDNQLLQGKSDIPIESPGTLNNTWGFKYDDHDWKTPETIETQLISLIEKNANYLLNVGPMPTGEFTVETNRILDDLAQWIAPRANAIYGTSATPFPQELADAFCTSQDSKLNFFIRKPVKQLTLTGIESRVCRSTVPYEQNGTEIRLDLSALPERDFLPLVTLEFNEVPRIRQEFLPQNGIVILPGAAAAISAAKDDHSAEYKVDVAGIGHKVFNHAHVEVDGSITDWKTSVDRLSWQVLFPEKGIYRVSIQLQTRWASRAWNGDRTIRLYWKGRLVSETRGLKPEQDFSNPYYNKKNSEIGVLTLTEKGGGTLSLETDDVSTLESAEMNFILLKLEKLK